MIQTKIFRCDQKREFQISHLLLFHLLFYDGESPYKKNLCSSQLCEYYDKCPGKIVLHRSGKSGNAKKMDQGHEKGQTFVGKKLCLLLPGSFRCEFK